MCKIELGLYGSSKFMEWYRTFRDVLEGVTGESGVNEGEGRKEWLDMRLTETYIKNSFDSSKRITE